MNNVLAQIYACIENTVLVKILSLSRNKVGLRTGISVLGLIFLCITFQPSVQAQNKNNKPLYLAVKNNLLYDAALLPNLTAEVYLDNQWSLAVEGNWSWWGFNQSAENEWFHRIQTAGVELRKWVCSPYPFYGHAVGIYGMIGNYDVRAFTKDETTTGWLSYGSWSAGVTYAYSIPISRYFNLEFGIAFGYVGGTDYQYDYCLEDEWWSQQAVHDRKYFGPTRAGISLAWLIGNGNYTRRREINKKVEKNK
jgi:hypothetical protein